MNFKTCKTKQLTEQVHQFPLKLCEKILATIQREVHLGLIRTPDGKAASIVDNNITKARKGWYSMMGAGLHSFDGLHPKCSIQLWNANIMPKLPYGLEVLHLHSSDFEELERYQRLVLRYLQQVPPGTPNEAVLLMLGVRPVQAVIKQNTLTFFRNICRLDNSKEKEILMRQACITETHSTSFAQRIKALLCKNNLRDPDISVTVHFR